MTSGRVDGDSTRSPATYLAQAGTGAVAAPSRQKLAQLRLALLIRSRGAAASDCVPLFLGDQIIGTVNAELALDIPRHIEGFELGDGQLRLVAERDDPEACSSRLNAVARWLSEQAGNRESPWQRLARPWRKEALDVRANPGGPVLGKIDRSAVRALGILTQSVRLHARLPDGRVLLARRASRKRIDPGLWDNLAAGLIAAGESPRDALQRESAEEAGLDLCQTWAEASLQAPTSGMMVDRSIPDGRLREMLHVYQLALEPGTACRNRDGEVQAFAAFTPDELTSLIESGAMSIEASLASIDALTATAL